MSNTPFRLAAVTTQPHDQTGEAIALTFTNRHDEEKIVLLACKWGHWNVWTPSMDAAHQSLNTYAATFWKNTGIVLGEPVECNSITREIEHAITGIEKVRNDCSYLEDLAGELMMMLDLDVVTPSEHDAIEARIDAKIAAAQYVANGGERFAAMVAEHYAKQQ